MLRGYLTTDCNNRDVFTASSRDNLTVGERRALKQLQNMPNIIIKAANKGGAIVVQSRQQYLKEGHRQLTDPKFYTKQEHDTTDIHQNKIKDFITIMFQNGEIDFSVYGYLINIASRTPILYLLHKIHKWKIPTPGTPIVSAVNSHMEKISQFVDHFLNCRTQNVASYIRDTSHFLTFLEEIHNLPEPTWLVMAESISLYTMIQNKAG